MNKNIKQAAGDKTSVRSRLCLRSCVSSGETCPQNGRSPGSISTQHSSPRSEFNSGNFSSNAGIPPNPATNATPSQPPDVAATQASDVMIQRKDTEGFGFVIISSLNRPETAAAAG